MRVLYVLRYWPTLTETFVYREIEGLIARGVHVEVAAIGSRADGALQDRLPSVFVHRPPRGLRGWTPALAALPSALPQARWLRRHQGSKAALRGLWLGELARGFDRLHAHFAGEAAEWAYLASQRAGIPFGVTVHAVDLFRPRPALLEVLGAASPVVTVAEHHRRWLRDLGVRATVVRCGVGSHAPATPDDKGPLRMIAVARNVPKKGLDLLASVRDLGHLHLVSDAPDAWGDEVGLLPPSRVAAALAQAHVFVLPCRVAPDGDRDGVPVALLEAMACGLPVVTTAVSGLPELVDEQVGWVVPPDDPSALRAALLDAALRPEERRRRGEAARARVLAGWTLEGE